MKKFNDFYEQLQNYPEEFSKAMNVAKDKNINSSLEFILNKLRIMNEVNDMSDDDREGFIDLLKMVYSFGFYAGVSFTLDPDKYLEDKENDK